MRIAKTATLLCLAALLLTTARAIWLLPGILRQEAALTRSQLLNSVDGTVFILAALSREQIEETRSALVSQLRETRRELLAELRMTRTDLTGTADLRLLSIQTDAALRLDTALAIADARLGETLEVADRSLGELSAVATPLAHTAQRISETSDLLLDCEGNPDCLPNRIIPAVRSIERAALSIEKTAAAVAEHAPTQAAALTRISQNVEVVTDRLVHPMHWAKRMALAGARIISFGVIGNSVKEIAAP